jgi:hypothetical protein
VRVIKLNKNLIKLNNIGGAEEWCEAEQAEVPENTVFVSNAASLFML